MSVFFDLCLNHFNAVYMSVLNKVIRISRLAIDHFFLAVFYFFTFSSVQSLSPVWLFVIPWTAAHQASLSITSSQSLLKLMSIKSVMPSNHLIFCCPCCVPPSGSRHCSQSGWSLRAGCWSGPGGSHGGEPWAGCSRELHGKMKVRDRVQREDRGGPSSCSAPPPPPALLLPLLPIFTAARSTAS